MSTSQPLFHEVAILQATHQMPFIVVKNYPEKPKSQQNTVGPTSRFEYAFTLTEGF